MVIDIETTLRDTRDRLRELGEAIEDLVKSYPSAFADPEIASRFAAFRQAHREAVDRLNAPRLCIATIGTTSSGKSTIVNALLGRKVAPIEAGEMSGGVLTLQHADERKLVVEATEGAAWETGVWSELSDESFYERIRNSVMLPYHDIRRKQKDCIAPQVIAFGPLLPACEPTLLSLPPGVGVEFVDLPGLKSVQDRANLAVIQTRVHKAFSLVALDYMQVDDEHRKRLLEELKRVVQYLQGRTDSMIFILNRVDQRGADDVPISERIDKLREEIQEVLSLEEPPEVIPFSARLLYYAQCAWGPGSLDDASLVDQPTRLRLLNAMFQDCAGVIRQQTSDDPELRRWFRNTEDQVCDSENISDETMRQLLHYALEWSGGNKLWSRLRIRVQEAFPELVLLPALVEVFDNYDSLAKIIEAIANIRKIEQKEEVEAEQAKIDQSRRRLHEAVENIREKFRTLTETTIEHLKKNEQDVRSRLAQEAQSEGRRGFQSLFDAVNEVEGDLTQLLIAPVRDALKENQGAYELEENLGKFISPVMANNIAKAYDSASRRLENFTHSSDSLVKRVREEDKKGIRELEHAERAVRKLYQAMREALSARAEFNLQSQAQKLENALDSLIGEEENELCVLCLKELPSLKLDEAIISDFKKNLSQNLPVLPEKFFELSNTIKQSSPKEKEVIGTKPVTITYTEGSCFNRQERTKTEYEDVIGDVQYRDLSLPDADQMARQWAEGVAKGKQGLWDVLSTWITNRLDLAIKVFDQSLNNVIDLVNDALQEQLSIIELNFAKTAQTWIEIEARKTLITVIRQKLEDGSRTSQIL